MSRIEYFRKRVVKMDYKALWKTTGILKKRSGKSRIWLAKDMLKCGVKYNAGYMDYKIAQMYKLNDEQRETVITRGISNDIVRRMNPKEYWHTFDDKAEFNEFFKEWIPRKWIRIDENTTPEDLEAFCRHQTQLIGKPIAKFLVAIKTWIRLLIRRNSKPVIFEDLGFQYFGPFDGHDIKLLKKKLKIAKQVKGPVLIHVATEKGKGYKLAEENPSSYHGVGPFDREKGVQPSGKKTFTDQFSESIIACGQRHEDLVAICAGMMTSTGLANFRKSMKLRFFDVGIAEQHAVTMAAGMAVNGFVPVVALYSTFAQRAYDQLLHDVCLQDLHVVMALDRAGIVGNDGATHHGLLDLAYLRPIPNMQICAPRTAEDLKQMLTLAETLEGPVAIRYPRGRTPNLDILRSRDVEYGKGIQGGAEPAFRTD